MTPGSRWVGFAFAGCVGWAVGSFAQFITAEPLPWWTLLGLVAALTMGAVSMTQRHEP